MPSLSKKEKLIGNKEQQQENAPIQISTIDRKFSNNSTTTSDNNTRRSFINNNSQEIEYYDSNINKESDYEESKFIDSNKKTNRDINQNNSNNNNDNDAQKSISKSGNVIITKKVRHKSNKSGSCFKNMFKFMFSNVGLVSLVFLYSTMGALMFQMLEKHEELRLCEEGNVKYLKELKYFKDSIITFINYNLSDVDQGSFYGTTSYYFNSTKIYDQSSYDSELLDNSNSNNNNNNNNSSASNKSNEIIFMLIEFRKKIIDIASSTGYVGQNCTQDSKWNFFSSLLFTITVISSVGYGFISPITWEGRIVCICYAVIGIPIFLLCLANLSSSLGGIFKFVYTKIDSFNPIRTFMTKRKLQKKMRKKMSKKLSTPVSRRSDLIADNVNLENVSYNDQRLPPQALDGLSNCRSEISSAFFTKELEDYGYDSGDSDEESDDNEEYYENPNEVPFTVAILVIFIYIMGGSFIFRKFEDWTIIQSVYFVYVTLSTMGFGDLVPGQRSDDKQTNVKLIAVCFYSLFGMAIIGMCFNVMQGFAKRNILKLTKKIHNLLNCFRKPKKSGDQFGNTITERERERREILDRIKKLQKYENFISSKRTKQHVLH